MSSTFHRFSTHIQTILKNLKTRPKIILYVGLSLSFFFLLFMIIRNVTPRYEILYSNLSPRDAETIIEKLQEQRVSYKLKNKGRTLLVPGNRVYDLRLDFTGEGIPEQATVRYVDGPQSDSEAGAYLQKANLRLAREKELTRTIEQIEIVEKARVHIAIPGSNSPEGKSPMPTASVIIKLKKNATLNASQVQGITHLLASSVAGLQPKNVTVIDTRGRILTGNENFHHRLPSSTTQLEYTEKVENYLTRKAQSLLDQILGPGNALVRISAELNFDQVEKTVEEFDPENTVVRSEEYAEGETPQSSSRESSSSIYTKDRTSTIITNYEINKTVQHIVENTGSIKRLSVAVLVKNKPQKISADSGEETVQYIPRTPQELDMLAEIVQRAIGFREDRHDDFSIKNVDFDQSFPEVTSLQDKTFPWSDFNSLLEKVLILIAIVVSIIIMRSLFIHIARGVSRVFSQKEEGAQSEENILQDSGDLSKTMGGDGGHPENEALQATHPFDSDTTGEIIPEFRNFARQSPQEVARLLKVWLMEEEQ